MQLVCQSKITLFNLFCTIFYHFFYSYYRMWQLYLKMHLFTITTKIFHYLPEEIAHRFALSGLKILYFSGLLKILIRNNFVNCNIPDSSFKGKGNYRNKLGIAAGLDKDGEYIDCLSALGVGFIEVGTVTPLPQPGNPKPRLFRNRTDKSLLNLSLIHI